MKRKKTYYLSEAVSVNGLKKCETVIERLRDVTA
jgi:hypothetical protein